MPRSSPQLEENSSGNWIEFFTTQPERSTDNSGGFFRGIRPAECPVPCS